MSGFSIEKHPVKRLIVSKTLVEVLGLGIENLPSYTDRIGLIYIGLDLLWELRDIWIGLYWDYKPPQMGPLGMLYNHAWTFYFCLIPCFPVRLTLVFSTPRSGPSED